MPARAADRKVKDLPERWRVWLEEEIYPLIDSTQTEAFLQLETDAQRQAYVDRLWVLWGRQTGYGSAFRRMYEERLEICRTELENTRSDRARVLLIHGPPDAKREFRCTELLYPLDFWIYGYIEGLGENVVVLFYQAYGAGQYRIWNPLNTKSVLYTSMGWQAARRPTRYQFDRPEMKCLHGDELLRLLAAAEYHLKDYKTFAYMNHMPLVEVRGPESASARFMEFSALLPESYAPLDIGLSSSPLGVRGGKVRIGFNVKVPASGLGTSEVGDVEVVQLDVVGEISLAEEMVDRFRYLFTVPSAGDALSLLLERSLRPGEYAIRLKVEDVHSRTGGVTETRFEVRPPTDEELAAMAEARAARARDAARAAGAAQGAAEGEAGSEGRQPESDAPLILLGPEGEGVSGLQRFEAITRAGIERVTFQLNGREVLTKNRPPFDVDLDLGPLPRLGTVTAIGYDASGREIDRRQLSLNVGRERFYLRIQPFGPDDRQGDKVFVSVEVNTPTETPLDRLELYWNDRLLAKLFEAPFDAWVDIGGGSAGDRVGYLRALAVLKDDSQAEDIRFITAPMFGTVVDVTSVELPVTVLDRSSGLPVADLTAEDFTVLEDGVEQTITHCSLHRDLPIRLGIVVDTSGSMEKTLPEVQRVVMGFLRSFLRPRDRAYIETFSDQPDILASFTADFETLENALLALYPDRSTAFYDSVIMGLFQFAGVRGRRSMVVLTDGADTASSHTYDEVIDYAQRTGVTIYTIGINIPSSQVLTRYQLSNLAKVTGGRSFFLGQGAKLESVYDSIDRELRTQYILAFTSGSTAPRDELRKIKVKVDRRGTSVSTIAGYYPGGF